MKNEKQSNWLKTLFIGKARDIHDNTIFHQLSLAAILAWVGLGADGLSSSCYGPEETMKALLVHPALAMFVALACVITIGVICVSYSQIIELFSSGGGGYLVASKLLSPSAGVVSGSALLVDYVLTIALSIAAGADALFSVLPEEWLEYKLSTAIITAGWPPAISQAFIWVSMFSAAALLFIAAQTGFLDGRRLCDEAVWIWRIIGSNSGRFASRTSRG